MKKRLTVNHGASDPDEEALNWLARKLSGTMNTDERRRFEDWIAESPAHRAAFAAAERSFGAVDAVGDDLLAEEFERQLLEETQKLKATRRQTFSRIAAGVAIAGAVGVAAVIADRTGPVRIAEYDTSTGELERVSLADGSEIELNTASRIAVSYDSKSRSIDLAAGEAFFNVEKDRNRPFIVNTAAATIVVTGTSFSVASYEGGAVIRVLTGVVEVAPTAGQESTLLAGDMIDVGRDGRPAPIERFDASLDFAWRSGKLRFREARLDDVVASLNRHFESPIMLDNDALGAIEVTGEFDVKDREIAIRALTLALSLQRQDGPAGTILKKAAAE